MADQTTTSSESASAPSLATGSTAQPLLEQTIGANLAQTAAKFGDREALIECWSGRRWTYREFDDAVTEVALAFLAAGAEPGDRVGMWAPNCAEWTLVQYGTARAGLILVNINPAYRTHELEYALNQSGCSMLVSATRYKTSEYADMVAQVRPKASGLRTVVLLDEFGPDAGVSDRSSEASTAGSPSSKTLAWKEFLAGAGNIDRARLDEMADALSPGDPINIQFTSGTTGRPKGATLSHRNLLNNGYFVTETIRFTENDRLVIPVPFYHCFGMVMANLGCTTHGAAMILPAPTFEPVSCLKAVQDEKATALYGVPTMFIAEQSLPDFDDYDLSTLRTGIMAGSPCPVEVMKKCMSQMHMTDVSIAYGMTETSPVSSQTGPDDDVEHRTSTIGRVHPHVEVKVVDPTTGEVVPRGVPGEFCTRGYSVMVGYWDDPERTDEAIDADGWMHTGDLAVMRSDDYLDIVGRIKDMVIRGGENIYPREIEEFYYTHPRITDIQVVGVPDAKYGEELCAFVRASDDAVGLDADELRAYATGKLAHYKIPRYVLVVEEFPMTVTGKVRKVDMRDTAARELGLTG